MTFVPSQVAASASLLPWPAQAKPEDKATIKKAAETMHQLQDRWTQLASKGAEGAKEILEAFSGVSYSSFTIKVPPGQSVGVDIEDRTITSVNTRKLGWSVGDTIQEINGQEAKDEETVVNYVKTAKQEGKELVFKVQRLSESPWVSLERALTNAYADVDAEVVLPEPDQVSDMFRDLKNNVNLAKDEIIEMAVVKVRMYMLNSGVVRAEPLKFKEEGVRDVVKDVFLPWYNAYRFLVQEMLIYSNLVRALPDGHPMKAKSVHFVMIPEPDMKAINPEITQAVRRMQNVVELGRTCRERRKVGLKMPLKSMTIMNKDQGFIKDVKALQKYIEEELNVVELNFRADAEITLSGTLNFKELGKRLGKDMKAVKDAVTNLSQAELVDFEKTGEITIQGHKLAGDDIQLSRKLKERPSLRISIGIYIAY
ncbi:unnamed protein product [Durusdinium trenchii]|uniref:PDZ domain-containing protein n=1 Tax=Durusdinium trenchii TaxID=1381693 RepID=A0ABP0SXD1_9DINO